jgi:hypothetical protein
LEPAKLKSGWTTKAALYFAGRAIPDFHPSADGRMAADDEIARNVSETQHVAAHIPLPFLFTGSPLPFLFTGSKQVAAVND